MHMVELPPIEGLGDTMWSDSHAVYLSLPRRVQEKINGATTTHDYRGFRAGLRSVGISEDSIAGLEADVPFGVTHPVVRTHPETGKQALYLHGGFMRHESFVGPDGVPYEEEESKKLVAYLLQQHARPETQARWSYKLHDIVMWEWVPTLICPPPFARCPPSWGRNGWPPLAALTRPPVSQQRGRPALRRKRLLPVPPRREPHPGVRARAVLPPRRRREAVNGQPVLLTNTPTEPPPPTRPPATTCRWWARA